MSRRAAVPALRLAPANAAPVRQDRDYVLYWMIAARRPRWNFALDRAVEWARELGKPLLVLEALRCGYPWASDRLHRFVLDGLADNERAFARRGIAYHPYVEPQAGAGKGLLAALGRRACVVVTDEFPCFMLPRMVAGAARQLPVLLETVDGNGLLPLRAAGREFTTAYSFRRHLQKTLPAHLHERPRSDPFAGIELPPPVVLPPAIVRRWPAASEALLRGEAAALAALPIDHGIRPVATRGGEAAARRAVARFVAGPLAAYEEQRNEPEAEGTSGLSPYLHFGHVAAHAVFDAVMSAEGWSPGDHGPQASGQRQGWWGVRAPAEAFLDQLVTWRELGYATCVHRPDYDRITVLPAWARKTLDDHAPDPRTHVYDLEAFAAARTHDPLWNAAQVQLLREGRMHNYLRMLWGKKILEWSESPAAALEIMIELNNRFALDGRNPNSYCGITWTLGRYDRPWAPERPVFGTVRFMSSQNTARKFSVRDYLRRYAAGPLEGGS